MMKLPKLTHVSAWTWLLWAIAGISLVATAGILPLLPPTVVMEGNGSPRPSWMMLLMSLLPLLSILLFTTLPYEQPDGNGMMRPRWYQMVMWIFTLLLIGAQWVITANAMGLPLKADTMAQAGIGMALLILGCTLLHAPFAQKGVAIRLPWVTNNPDVWRKTHLLGGICFICSGTATLVATLLSIIKPLGIASSVPTLVLLGSLLAATVIIMIASVRIATRQASKVQP